MTRIERSDRSLLPALGSLSKLCWAPFSKLSIVKARNRKQQSALLGSMPPQVCSPTQQQSDAESSWASLVGISAALSHQYSCHAGASKNNSANVTQQAGLEAGTEPTQNAQAVAGVYEHLVYLLMRKVCKQAHHTACFLLQISKARHQPHSTRLL